MGEIYGTPAENPCRHTDMDRKDPDHLTWERNPRASCCDPCCLICGMFAKYLYCMNVYRSVMHESCKCCWSIWNRNTKCKIILIQSVIFLDSTDMWRKKWIFSQTMTLVMFFWPWYLEAPTSCYTDMLFNLCNWLNIRMQLFPNTKYHGLITNSSFVWSEYTNYRVKSLWQLEFVKAVASFWIKEFVLCHSWWKSLDLGMNPPF